MAEHLDIPKDIADEWDSIVKTLHGKLKESRKELRKRTGTRPFKGKVVTQEDKLIQLGSLDQEAWTAIFQKHGKFKEDGRLLLPNTMLKQAKDLNKLMHRGEFDL